MADVEQSNPTPTPTPVPSPPTNVSAEEINVDDDEVVESASPVMDDPLELQRQKNKDRAKRFGVEYREPSKDLFVPLREPRRYKNKNSSGFVTGIDLTSEEEKLKREQRAAKFNMSTEPTKQEESLPAGEGMDVDLREPRKDVPDNVARKMDTLHMYGTDKMSTDEVFKYFIDYGPTHVEWIDDSSCNVIFADAATALRALKGLAVAPIDAPSNGDGTQNTGTFDIGIGWYTAKPSGDSHIQLRFATADDVKPLVPKPSVWSRPPRKSYKAGKSRKNKQGKGQHNQQQQGTEGKPTTRKKRNSRNRKLGDVAMKDSLIPDTPEEEEKRKQRRLRFGLEKPTEAATTVSSDTTTQ